MKKKIKVPPVEQYKLHLAEMLLGQVKLALDQEGEEYGGDAKILVDHVRAAHAGAISASAAAVK